jgi:hypothetical protein
MSGPACLGREFDVCSVVRMLNFYQAVRNAPVRGETLVLFLFVTQTIGFGALAALKNFGVLQETDVDSPGVLRRGNYSAHTKEPYGCGAGWLFRRGVRCGMTNSWKIPATLPSAILISAVSTSKLAPRSLAG